MSRAARAQGLPGRQADRRLLRRSPAPAPASPASSRSPRSRAGPMPRWSPATASPASSSPSSPARTRSPSSRSRSSLGGIAAAGGLIQRRMGLPDATVQVLQGLHVRRPAGQRDPLRPLRHLPQQRERPMNGASRHIVLIAMIGGAIRVSTPFLFVSLGECLTEKSGRINLGLEGTLVFGAMAAYAIAYKTGSPWIGVLVAGLAGIGLRRPARLHLQAPQGQRHRHRHRADAVRHRPRLLLGQALHPAAGAAPPLDSRSAPGRTTRSVQEALQVNPLFLVGHRARRRSCGGRSATRAGA